MTKMMTALLGGLKKRRSKQPSDESPNPRPAVSALKTNLPLISSSLLELSGIAGISYGSWLFSHVLGFIVGGFSLIIVGLAVDPPMRQPKNSEPR